MTPEDLALGFPKDFLWGVATAAYQIEGAIKCDGRGPSIWDTYSHAPGRIIDAQSGDDACDHYRRMESDVELMASLGITAYRFSVAWPRILPTGSGAVEPRGLAFYSRLVDRLRDVGIEPVVTLYHWDLPQALQDRGGWTNRETVTAFSHYARVVFAELGDRVRMVATLNEPWCSAFLGYGSGQQAPGLTDPRAALRAAYHLLLAHGEATAAMRRVADPTHQLGIVLNLVPVDPATSSAADVGAATLIDGLQNRLFLDPVLRASLPEDVRSLFTRFRADDAFRPGDLERIAQPIDFLGVNYYFRSHVRSGGLATTFSSAFPGSDHVEFVEQAVQRTAAGFPIEPSGLFELLVSLRDDYGNPAVIVAENGAAFEDDVDGDDVNDDDRITFLADHILEIRNAIADGAKVRGYFVWTLMDNFEWSLGFTARYGLVRVERATGRRVEKASARWYRRLISAWRA